MQLAQDTTKMLSNVQTETKQFGIKDMSLVMSLLTKMYANPIQTLTQEYISNARDANREVRQTKRIQIQAPSRFDSIIKIRDFGPGLSPDRIENVFLFYGSSTKRATNTQTGGFGIGAKSAWAYTDSFTIISYYEGTKRTYIAHKSGGNGNLNLISEEMTTEANGTAIHIAVNPNDVPRFKAAILRTIFFWKDSEQPELKGFDTNDTAQFTIQPEFELFKEFKIYKQFPSFLNCNDHALAIIDGIPYPVRINLDKTDKLIKQKFVVYLNTGDVEMAPNREEFINDPVSQAFFKQLDETISKKLSDYINQSVSKLPSLKDGLKQYIKLLEKFEFTGKYKNFTINYQGISIVDPTSQSYNNTITLGNRWELYRQKYKKNDFNNIPLDRIDSIFYDDMPNEAATKKVWRIKKNLGGPNRYFFLLANDKKAIADELAATPLSSIDATDYAIQRQAKAAVKKQEICLHYFERGLSPTQVNLSDVTTLIIYASHSGTDGIYGKRNSNSHHSVISYINSKDGMRFAFIADMYMDKIKSNKNFIHYDEFVKTHKVDDKQLKYYLKLKQEPVAITNNLEYLKPIKDSIKDPAIKYFIDLLDFSPGNTVSSYMPDEFYNRDHKLVKEFEEMNLRAVKFDKDYPLLRALISETELLKKNQYYKDDATVYLNRKFKELSK